MSNRVTIDDPSRLGFQQRLSFLVKDSTLYGLAAALNKAFALITFPLLARHFSLSEYGLIDLFSVVGALLATFFIFGQDSAVARYFYEYKDETSRRQVISQSLALQLTFVLSVLPLLWITSRPLAIKLSGAQSSILLLKLILLQVPFQVLVNFSVNLLKWTFSRTRFLFISLGSSVLNVLILLMAIGLFDIEVQAVFLISLVVQACFGLMGIWFVRQWLTVPVNLKFLRELLPFAIPYGLLCCIGAFVPAMERTLVNSLLGGNELGLYAAGSKIAMALMLFSQAFQTAWGPFSLAVYKTPDVAETYNWILKGFTIGICAVVLFLSAVGSPLINFLATSRYAGAGIIIFPLSMGLAIQSVSWITGIGIILSKKSYLSLYGYGAFLLVTGSAIYCLGQIFGIAGVAFGVMLGRLAEALVSTVIAQKAYPLKWHFIPPAALMAITMLVGCWANWVAARLNSITASFFFIGGIGFVLTAGWFIMFSKSERYRIKSAIYSMSFFSKVLKA